MRLSSHFISTITNWNSNIGMHCFQQDLVLNVRIIKYFETQEQSQFIEINVHQ